MLQILPVVGGWPPLPEMGTVAHWTTHTPLRNTVVLSPLNQFAVSLAAHCIILRCFNAALIPYHIIDYVRFAVKKVTDLYTGSDIANYQKGCIYLMELKYNILYNSVA